MLTPLGAVPAVAVRWQAAKKQVFGGDIWNIAVSKGGNGEVGRGHRGAEERSAGFG